ncbi:MAG: hypothetical protein J7574_04820 [Flavobacterium sp.]|uniref:hypothetical protein n=1 Tax=Flavobacterium sp. TaxID=239 RepID=UPI001B1FC0D6|nr:hypothetical protein [Flavobacterium sp.]MBO9583463.1 hypothetical protein [Flavobacterium sp.]
MKKYLAITVFGLMILTSCDLGFSGTLGGGNIHRFNCTEEKLNFYLDNIEKHNLSLRIPKKWKKYDNWEQKGYNFLKGKIFYLREEDSNDDEMYYVSVIPPKENFNKNPGASVRAVFRMVDNKPRWLYLRDLWWFERREIEKKFEKKY